MTRIPGSRYLLCLPCYPAGFAGFPIHYGCWYTGILVHWYAFHCYPALLLVFQSTMAFGKIGILVGMLLDFNSHIRIVIIINPQQQLGDPEGLIWGDLVTEQLPRFSSKPLSYAKCKCRFQGLSPLCVFAIP